MTQSPVVLVHFKDLEFESDVDEGVRNLIDRRCAHLADEFREVTRFEINLSQDGNGFVVHGHATGKNTNVATHAAASEAAPATDQVLGKIERQLRRMHDKRIFGQRRDAQKDPHDNRIFAQRRAAQTDPPKRQLG
jgi:ribosomal subunit interface protein